ncbi:MAG: histidine phosphatase family protein [Candidatus Heimdallarchaeota archaeon]|nr:MAG: histidine phosphatase family protein [Candidatus Heimdallarchaeota archaeon]
MKIVLVRHGQSEANSMGVLQGHMDSPLTSQGRLQAIELAQRMILMGYISFDRIYSSDLVRAAETATIIGKKLKINDINYTPLLREMDLGIYVGRKWDQLQPKERLFFESISNDHSKQIPNGESINSLVKRLQQFLNEVGNLEPPPSLVLVITHGGPLNHLLRTILDLLPETDEWFENCKMTEIEWLQRQTWRLLSFNEKKIDS